MAVTKEDARDYFVMKGMLTELPPEQQATYKDVHARITAIVKENKELGVIAIAMIGMEMAIADEG